MQTETTPHGVTWTLTKPEAQALLACASKDAARVNLTGVHLGAHAVTTDGHRLMCADPDTDARGRAVTIARQALEVLVKTRGCASVEIAIPADATDADGATTPPEGTALDKQGAVIISCQLPEIGGEFPPYRQVIPDAPAAEAEPCFNPRYLADGFTTLGKAGCTIVSVRFTGELDPATFCGKSDSARWMYLVMPMRGTPMHWAPKGSKTPAANAA